MLINFAENLHRNRFRRFADFPYSWPGQAPSFWRRVLVLLLGLGLLRAALPVPVRAEYGIAASAISSHVLTSDGAVLAWGGNQSGQLGDGTTAERHTPISVDSGFVALASGYSHTLGIKKDGSLWGWGSNSFGELGNNTTESHYEPQQIGSGFTAIAAGNCFSLALKADGSLWAWGNNQFGQLGDNTTTAKYAPLRIGDGFTAIAVGQWHVLALKADGSLWAWGYNKTGQLGDNSTTDRHQPKQIAAGVVAIAAGASHSLGIKTDGSLWGWGINGSGQVGDNSRSDRHAPVAVGTGYMAVAAGGSHSLGIKNDGTLWAWGWNGKGQLGDGTTSTSPAPIQIGSGYAAVAAGESSLAMRTDGSLWAWGDNTYGELGDGTTEQRLVPTQVVGQNGVGVLNLLSDALVFETPVLAPGTTLSHLSGSVGTSVVYQVSNNPRTQGTLVTTSGTTGNLELRVFYEEPTASSRYNYKSLGNGANEEVNLPRAGLTYYVMLKPLKNYEDLSLSVASIPVPKPQTNTTSFTDIALTQYEEHKYTMHMTSKYRNLDLLLIVSKGDIGIVLDGEMQASAGDNDLTQINDNTYRLRLQQIPIGDHSLVVFGMQDDNVFSFDLQQGPSLSPATLFNLLLN